MRKTSTILYKTEAGLCFYKVTEKTSGHTVKDEDFVQIGRPMTVDWKGKFLEAEGTVQKFKVYISTYPGGKYYRNKIYILI